MSAVAEGPDALRLGEDDRDFRWMVFAGIVLLILGCANIVEGVAGVDGSSVFTRHAHYLFGDLSSWGWAIWLLGIAQGLAALGVLVRNQVARWAGVLFANLNALAQLFMIQAYPLWSLALFGLDVLVMYALVVHGGRRYRPA
jgi:hypothetical protein